MSDKVQILRNLQDDAHQNHFTITFTPLSALSGVENGEIAYRIQNVSIPGSGSEKYPIHHKGDFIEKTTPKNNMTKEISFTFRVDQNWYIYEYMKSWKNLVFNTYSGTKDTPDELTKVPVIITVEDANDNTKATWTFEGCRVTNIGDISLDYSSGEPITVDVTLSFDAMNDMDLLP